MVNKTKFTRVVLRSNPDDDEPDPKPNFPYYHDMLIPLFENRFKMTRDARKRALKLKKQVKDGTIMLNYAEKPEIDGEIEEVLSQKKSLSPVSGILTPHSLPRDSADGSASGIKTPESAPSSPPPRRREHDHPSSKQRSFGSDQRVSRPGSQPDRHVKTISQPTPPSGKQLGSASPVSVSPPKLTKPTKPIKFGTSPVSPASSSPERKKERVESASAESSGKEDVSSGLASPKSPPPPATKPPSTKPPLQPSSTKPPLPVSKPPKADTKPPSGIKPLATAIATAIVTKAVTAPPIPIKKPVLAPTKPGIEKPKKKRVSGDSLGSLSDLSDDSDDVYSASANKKRQEELKKHGKTLKQLRREAKIREYYQRKCQEAKEIYPEADVPEISDSTPVLVAKRKWLNFYNLQKLRSRLSTNRDYLTVGASVLEGLGRYWGLDVKGFVKETAANRSAFNGILAKIGKNSFARYTENLPAEVQAAGMLVWRFAWFFIGKRFGIVPDYESDDDGEAEQAPGIRGQELDYSEKLASASVPRSTTSSTKLRGPSWNRK